MTSESLDFARSNRLLGELSDNALARLLENHTVVALRQKAVLHEPGAPIDCAYFPLTAVISWMAQMRNGKRSEVMTFGCEGMAGIAAAFDSNQGAVAAVVQNEGSAIRIPAAHLKDSLEADRETAAVFYRYATSLMNIMAQNSACNRLHDLSERCAKWVLLMHDRAQSDELLIDQQLLADMLGARRQSISQTTTMLQNAGLIKRRRSRTIVLDRRGLERASCECYSLIACEAAPSSWFQGTHGRHSGTAPQDGR